MLSPPKPFKFFNLWTKHAGFLQVIEHSWTVSVPGNSKSVLHYKLKRLKTALRSFNQTQFGGISTKVGEKMRELASVQMRLLSSPTEDLAQLEKSLSLELYDLIIAEESFFKQKSRITWIQEGDQNTKFFHKSMVVQQNRNTIRNLTSADGIKLNTFSQISEEAISFFQNLLGTKDEQVTQCNVLPDLIQSNLTDEAVAELCKPVYAKEVKESMFVIGDDKALGPDGYTAHFFKKACDIVGVDVIDEVLSFFHTNKLNPAFNSTIIALVPKKQAPNSIRDYRPISCCSVIYKCIARILTTRMKKYMPDLISGNQSAFICGRSIADNVLMVQELVRGYGRKSLSPRCAIKVDL